MSMTSDTRCSHTGSTVQSGDCEVMWYAQVTGTRTPLYPDFLMSSNVAATTGGLFQLPSVSIASSVLPTFHPGLMLAKNFAAVMVAKDELEGHVTPVLLPIIAASVKCCNARVLYCEP
jgi:hypothetical protein